MSEYTEIVETRGDYRARIISEDGPSEPYNDGGSPILRLRWDRNWDDTWYAEQITGITSHVVDSQIALAAGRWGSDTDTFERYLRIFHGTSAVEWYDSRSDGGDYVYVTFDTAAWREDVGAPENSVEMSEWRSYVEGDVWCHVVEKRTVWVKAPSDVNDPDAETMTTWEEVEDTAVWGFYGHEWAEQAAREALNDVAPNTSA